MSRKLLFLLIGVIYFILIVYGLSTVYSVGNPQPAKQTAVLKPDNKISIAHTEIFGKLERPQVIFDHKKHDEAFKKDGCKTCHPVDEYNRLILDFPKKVSKKDKTSVMKAYHDQCIDCHKKKSSENKKTGPVVCADCHKEKGKSIVVKYPIFEFDFYYHDKHVKKLKEKIGKDDCSLCHHTYDIEEDDEALALVYEKGTEESCYYCHELGKKRGPELTAITKVSAKKGLSIRKVSHQQCLNCHLKYQEEYQKKGEKEACPTECSKCHTGKYKTVAELEKVSRPARDQKEKPFINIKDAKLKGVTFDHKYHETASKTCRSCHHETLKACKECHDLVGKPEGNEVNVARAYHDVFSGHSCEGCHNKKKLGKDCFGCHSNIPAIDVESVGPKRETCAICHSGEIKGPLSRPPLSVAKLDPEKVKKEVIVKVLEREFEPSKFPHLKIIEKLVKISNDSKLANYFHKDMQTLCKGCHHRSLAEAEVKKDTPPNCRNCHTLTFDPQNLNKTKLLLAYHRQCLGCHKKMELEKGRKCFDCHKEKKDRPKSITSVKNFEADVRLLEKLGY